MKIRHVGAELFHANRQTDKHYGAHSLFLQFYQSAKNLKGLGWTGYVARMGGIVKHKHLLL
jgi:hypothetical protein